MNNWRSEAIQSSNAGIIKPAAGELSFYMAHSVWSVWARADSWVTPQWVEWREAMTSGPCIVQHPPCSSIYDKDQKSLLRCGKVCFSQRCNSNPKLDRMEFIIRTSKTS